MVQVRIPLAALPPTVLAVALMAPGGCGPGGSSSDTSKFQGDQKDVAQTVYDLRDAVSKRDEGKLCDSYLSASFKTQLAAAAKTGHRGSSCSDDLKDSVQDVDATDVKVESVDVTGKSATAKVKTNLPHGTDPCATYTFVNERGWRLSGPPTDTPC